MGQPFPYKGQHPACGAGESTLYVYISQAWHRIGNIDCTCARQVWHMYVEGDTSCKLFLHKLKMLHDQSKGSSTGTQVRLKMNLGVWYPAHKTVKQGEEG